MHMHDIYVDRSVDLEKDRLIYNVKNSFMKKDNPKLANLVI